LRDFGIEFSDSQAMDEYISLTTIRFDATTARPGIEISKDGRILRSRAQDHKHDKVLLTRELTPGTKLAFEIEIVNTGWAFIGVAPASELSCASMCVSGTGFTMGFDGHLYDASTAQFKRDARSIQFVNGCVIGIAIDMTESRVWYYRNGENVGFTRKPIFAGLPLFPIVEARTGVEMHLGPPRSFVPPWMPHCTPLSD
jgi:hypothetical protein